MVDLALKCFLTSSWGLELRWQTGLRVYAVVEIFIQLRAMATTEVELSRLFRKNKPFDYILTFQWGLDPRRQTGLRGLFWWRW
jgi:hypothetical protein